MKCDIAKVLFVDYFENQLKESESGQVASHIGGCDNCNLEFQQLKRIWTLIDNDLDQEPPNSVQDRFYSLMNEQIAGSTNDQVLITRSLSNFWFFRANWNFPAPAAITFSLVIMGSGVLLGNWFSNSSNDSNSSNPSAAYSDIQSELSGIRSMLASTLLKQDSIQLRMQGVEHALQSNSNDLELINTLLETAEKDTALSVRLAAIEVLNNYREYPIVKTRIYDGLFQESSPLVQLRMGELLLSAAEGSKLQLLEELLMLEIFNATVVDQLKELANEDSQYSTDHKIYEL